MTVVDTSTSIVDIEIVIRLNLSISQYCHLIYLVDLFEGFGYFLLISS